ncbi:hypothetical protein TRFO_07026 [Tritrichomonas foetus]|uniref:Uncharacterized protein n=1 Tax=Tritrichomonas foetus TaxID=1144522 RepID=A0A1J4JZD0_9EUKA|nr:hypothetical protein TRFO_07026 [Tritrichomonas foetus]|eukprot:OHT02613.1 hypothetical protein TRFO_07026 [Tritrichomonas foetus]
MEGKIYVKDAIAKQFPNMTQHLIPPLFIDSGIMPDRKGGGRTKTCYLYVNIAGVYFLRPVKLSKTFKIAHFISTYQIIEIKYIDAKRRTLVIHGNEMFFECSHPDELIEAVISSRALLFQGIPESKAGIQFTGFYQQPQPHQINTNLSISVLRYVSYCIRYNEHPQISFVESFSHITPANCTQFTLESCCIAPSNLRCIFIPIIQVGRIRTLRLVNFAPFVACRFVHFILKHTHSTESIIFEGYSNLVPEQLRFENVPPKRLLSFSFVNCKLSEQTYIKLIDKICEYQGEIQKLSFNGVTFNAEAWGSISNSILANRPWKTLEHLEFDNIESKNISNDAIVSTISRILKHCRFVQHLSISNWSQPILVGLDTFLNCSILSEIVLAKQDMTEPFPDYVRIPSSVHYLDFNHSNFTFLSLQSLLKVISYNTKTPIYLVLSDISLPDAHWRSLYAAFPSFPQIKCLRGLDWSGNMLESASIQPFFNFFFLSNRIIHLSIDRVFGAQRSDDLRSLLGTIGQGRISSISICGSIERNFGGSMDQLFHALELLGPISILRLDGQHMADSDISATLDYLYAHKNLLEFSINDTAISVESQFFDLYNDLLKLPIKVVGRPNADINRLFHRTLSALSDRARYSAFRTAIREKLEPLGQSFIGFFICRIECGDRIDPIRYQNFIQRYPPIYQSFPGDEFYLGNALKKPRFPSLTTLRVKTPCRTLSDIHIKLIPDPTRPPRYLPPADNGLPSIFDESGLETIPTRPVTNINYGGNYTKLEPLCDTPEMNQVLSILTETVEEEEENEPVNAQAPSPFMPETSMFEPVQPFTNNSMFAPDTTPPQLQPLQPLDPSMQPLQPLDPSMQPLQPLDLSMQPLQPLDPSMQPLQPLDGLQPLGELQPLDPLQPLDQLQPLDNLQPLDPIPLMPLDSTLPPMPMDGTMPLFVPNSHASDDLIMPPEEDVPINAAMFNSNCSSLVIDPIDLGSGNFVPYSDDEMELPPLAPPVGLVPKESPLSQLPPLESINDSQNNLQMPTNAAMAPSLHSNTAIKPPAPSTFSPIEPIAPIARIQATLPPSNQQSDVSGIVIPPTLDSSVIPQAATSQTKTSTFTVPDFSEPLQPLAPPPIPSAAGGINLLPVFPSAVLLTPKSHDYSLPGSETGVIPQNAGLPPPGQPHTVQPLGTVEVDDVLSFAKNAVPAPPPEINIRMPRSRTDVDRYYSAGMPFQYLHVKKTKNPPQTSHPMENRQRQQVPNVNVLGTPNGW